ncbi:Uncharacterised protein [Vibrio cholerae]|uniref:Uncharacterized protein n=1 Tax=Vibrio cholerae TaxID=666 RepID=A0A656AZ50_VIBCL|nr:Uncharacterised protein [Vibrio cholerae]CSB32416.1 Uncharacterised protein [Vibrio cholerae]CSB37129.1 Uncharacterised protein [Vibrio cholerae]CSB55620.1 Uncharacterised protein [Vibrio cholerae]CSB93722.1 Uncharacterised protein [Vibrio cholerae]
MFIARVGVIVSNEFPVNVLQTVGQDVPDDPKQEADGQRRRNPNKRAQDIVFEHTRLFQFYAIHRHYLAFSRFKYSNAPFSIMMNTSSTTPVA